MSTGLAVEVGADVEPSAIINTSLCLDLARQAKAAARRLALAGGAAKDAWLIRSAAAIVERREEILSANAADVAAAPGRGL
jgi:glutamate-5-semialdehyde dehydrogenase